MDIKENIFGMTPEGKKVKIFTLEKSGIEARVITYGGILQKLAIPDKEGDWDDIVLGFDSLQGYLKDDSYLGATIGRYANRISEGIIDIDGEKIQLPQNDGKNHLHGGERGFNNVVWKAKKIKNDESIGVKLTYISEDGEQNYPGNLKTNVTYLLEEKKLKIIFEAETDKKTPVNMTHHSYFNLTGARRDILDHELKIKGEYYLPVNSDLIPTGEKKKVENTPMDFTTLKKIGARIEDVEGGYDHNWILNKENNRLEYAAEIVEPQTGRRVKLYTTKPGLQFYSGNSLGFNGKKNTFYEDHYGLCLEPQYYPDSPNQSDFPFSYLEPGDKYEHKIVYEFDTVKNIE